MSRVGVLCKFWWFPCRRMCLSARLARVRLAPSEGVCIGRGYV